MQPLQYIQTHCCIQLTFSDGYVCQHPHGEWPGITVLHWATALSLWPVHVLGILCLRRSVGVHHLTFLNAHWKPIYTSTVIS